MEERFQTFTLLISKITRCIRKIKSEEMREYDLKTPHVSCLYYLYINNAPMTATELVEMCDEDKAAISRSIEYLENNGFLICDSKSEKRYKSPIFLTEKGRKVGGEIIKKINNVLKFSNQGLSDDDLNKFYKGLSLISENLKNICDKYGE